MKVLFLFILLGLTNVIANEKSLYDFKWLDEGEKVYVIQNKEYVKSKRFEVGLSLADTDSSPYQDTLGLVFDVTYYLNENWSLGFRYKSYSNSDSADLTSLLEDKIPAVKPKIRKIDSGKILYVNWLPFYGKVNTFNEIVFFDWGLGLGLGQYETQGNYRTFNDTNIKIVYDAESELGFSMRSFIKFYLRHNITMGIEYDLSGVNSITDTSGSKEILFYTDIMAKVGYLF